MALGLFQRDEAGSGAKITRVVCVTDASTPIFPGPCCREFLLSSCDLDTEVVAAGTEKPTELSIVQLRDLLPLPSAYRRCNQSEMKVLGESLSSKVTAPDDDALSVAYSAAVVFAKRQKKQAFIFPVLFAAAVRFADGRVHTTAELKGVEYGCTVDAVSLLLPEMLRTRDESGIAATCIVQADHFGLAHAPFAAARSLLIEHGFGDTVLCAHDDKGEWCKSITAQESMPHATYTTMF